MVDKLKIEALVTQWGVLIERKKEIQAQIDSLRKEIGVLMENNDHLSVGGYRITKFPMWSNALGRKMKEKITVIQIRKEKTPKKK